MGRRRSTAPPADLDSPVGIVGAGRIGGEILDSDNTSSTDKLVLFLNLLAGFNMSLFLLNMLPLLPLDGGHILGRDDRMGPEGLGLAAAQTDPGPFDVAKSDAGGLRGAVLLFVGLSC